MTVMADLISIYDREVRIHRGYARHGLRKRFSAISGVCHTRISNWRSKCGARLDLFEAVANALGYRLVLQHIETGEIFSSD